MRAIRTALSSLLVLLTLTGPAAGQGTDEAEAIYEQAVAAFEAEEFADAARLFEQVFALDPHPVIMHSLARAYQELGDLPNALLYFRNIRTMNAREDVQGSAETKIGEIEDELRTQGYDPDVVTSATYVPRGNLTITSQPEGAGVYINGDFQGTTPFIEPRVDEGTYSLRIELEGYHPIVEELEVQGGRTNLRSYSLEARTTLDDYVPPTPGYLTVRAPSPDLEVHVDGDLFGVTPIVGQGLPPGTYIVAISGEG